MKTQITAQLLLSIIAIFFGNEIITAIIPNNPTEHLAVCLIWVALVCITFATRAIKQVQSEMEHRRAEAAQAEWNRTRL